MDEIDKRHPPYWRARAAKARAIAQTYESPDARVLMLKAAEHYDWMAVELGSNPPKRTIRA